MTHPIAKHEKLKQEQARITEELDKLEKEEAYQQAVAFKKDIDGVLKKHGKTDADLLELLGQPSANKANKAPRKHTGKTLPWKRYTNPHTDEEVVAKSLKKPKLQEWKDEYGAKEVQNWGVPISDEEAAKALPNEPSKEQKATVK